MQTINEAKNALLVCRQGHREGCRGFGHFCHEREKAVAVGAGKWYTLCREEPCRKREAPLFAVRNHVGNAKRRPWQGVKEEP